ncbi:hypothetical protein EG835_03460, partial [bacterium]|nr:hypothetical protein [bacterium]
MKKTGIAGKLALGYVVVIAPVVVLIVVSVFSLRGAVSTGTFLIEGLGKTRTLVSDADAAANTMRLAEVQGATTDPAQMKR